MKIFDLIHQTENTNWNRKTRANAEDRAKDARGKNKKEIRMQLLKKIFQNKKPITYSYNELLAIQNEKKAQKEFLARADGGERLEVFLEMYEHERKFKSFVLNQDPDELDKGQRLIYSVFADIDVNASLKLLSEIAKTTGSNLLVDIVYAKFATDYYMNNGSNDLKEENSSPIRFYKDDIFDFSSEHVHRDYQIYPKHNRFRYFSHFVDDISNSTTAIYEYQINGYKIDCRLHTRYSDNGYGKDEYDVKDNVVLEAEIRERASKNQFLNDDVDESLVSLKEDTEWHPLIFNQLRYFILTKHIQLQTDYEFRKHLRAELERIKLAVFQFNEHIQKYHLKSILTEYGLEIHYPENCTDEDKLKLASVITENLFTEYRTTRDEYTASKEIQNYLAKLLGDENEDRAQD